MKGEEIIVFSLSSFLKWKVESDDINWLDQNKNEFRLSLQNNFTENFCDILVKQVAEIQLEFGSINVSEGIYCLSESIYIKDKFSNKKLHIQISGEHYQLNVEQGFTFHYYAAILDGFIKILAFRKGIVALHASAIKKDDIVSVFTAWRRMGKTTAILNLLARDPNVEILADDAVMITGEGLIVPYLRGIDLYPYLPISNGYLGGADRIKRFLANGLKLVPLLPKTLKNKIVKRFLLPRLNFANHGHGRNIEPVSINYFYAIKRHFKPKTQKNIISPQELKNFIGRSSYFELIEYLSIFEMTCSVFPRSEFSKLLIDYGVFQDKVNQSINDQLVLLDLNLSKNYSDLKDLNTII